MGRVDVIGSQINNFNMAELLEKVDSMILEKVTSYICVSNVHTTVMGRQNEYFRRITNDSALSIPDGMPLVWIGRCRGHKHMGRCAGGNLMVELFKISEAKGYTHYFYGGSQETLDMLKVRLAQEYPGMEVKGLYSPPYRQLTQEEEESAIDKINELKPDIVWVGLGAPRQEIWMKEHMDKIKASVLVGVGAAFNFHAGSVKRAPLWMQKAGLEWFYRFIQEPRRLWKRYFTTNFLFIFYITIDLIKKLLGLTAHNST